jgi:hypothetical protein
VRKRGHADSVDKKRMAVPCGIEKRMTLLEWLD